MDRILKLWEEIYGDSQQELLSRLLNEVNTFNNEVKVSALEEEWYKDVTVYSIYVDLFNVDFKGLEEKLDYLQDLGVSCLWLLPILDSPLRDAGFDIQNYQAIRPDLLNFKPQDEVFDAFMEKAHQKGIKVIFDIAVNHTSDQHPWFKESKKGKDNPYRNYYIWNKDDKLYKDARIIFYGIEESNWRKEGDEYFFHRFFDFQPDLNYRNPQVMIEMVNNFLFWLRKGVDGFRVDAIPYIWKEEGTDCENLPMTHKVVQFFRAVVDVVRPNTLLLAEACQKPHEVVKYFGEGDECHAGYHFPLMPQMYKALGKASNQPIIKTLSEEITPVIPDKSQWFTFLRCHDELSLELVYVSEEDRKFIHDTYCKQPAWDFRLGQGISARLSELMDNDPDKIALIYSVMMTLPGTPVVYYGDEFGKQNDHDYYKEQIAQTGKDDTRFLVRGRVDWDKLKQELKDEHSLSAKVFGQLSKLIKTRSDHKVFGRGKIQWLQTEDNNDGILMYIRSYKDSEILILQNLTSINQHVNLQWPIKQQLISNLAQFSEDQESLILGAYGYAWCKL